MDDTPEIYFIAHYTSHKCIYVSTYVHVNACIYVWMYVPHYKLVPNTLFIEVHNNLKWVYLLLVSKWSYINTVLLSVFCMWNWRSSFVNTASIIWPTVRLTVPITENVWFHAFKKIQIQHSLTIFPKNSTCDLLTTVHNILFVLTLLHS